VAAVSVVVVVADVADSEKVSLPDKLLPPLQAVSIRADNNKTGINLFIYSPCTATGSRTDCL